MKINSINKAFSLMKDHCNMIQIKKLTSMTKKCKSINYEQNLFKIY